MKTIDIPQNDVSEPWRFSKSTALENLTRHGSHPSPSNVENARALNGV